MLFIPFCHGGVLVHVLDDISPPDARVVSTETNLALLCAVRNYAHLGATEVIVEEILEPHARDEKKIPAIRAPLRDVLIAPIATNLAVIFSGQSK